MEPIPETVRAIEELGPFAADEDLLEQLQHMADRVEAIVPDCIGMSVASIEHGVTFTLVASNPLIAVLDAIQYVEGGPCVEAAERGQVVTWPVDPTSEEAWRLLAQASGRVGVQSTLSLPVLADDRISGSVNLYGASTDSFTGHHEELATVVEGRAADATINADLSFSTRQEAEDAPRRLQARSLLEEAVSIVVAKSDLDSEIARTRLELAARRAGIGPLQFAEALLKLGLPQLYCPGRLVKRVMGVTLPIAVWGRWWLYSWSHAGRAVRRADSVV